MRKMKTFVLVLAIIALFFSTGCDISKNDPAENSLVTLLKTMNKRILELSEHDNEILGLTKTAHENIVDLYAQVLAVKAETAGAYERILETSQHVLEAFMAMKNHKEAILSVRDRVGNLEARVALLDGRSSAEVVLSTSQTTAEVTASDFEETKTSETAVQSTSEVTVNEDDLLLNELLHTPTEQALFYQTMINKYDNYCQAGFSMIREYGLSISIQEEKDENLKKLMKEFNSLHIRYLTPPRYQTLGELKAAKEEREQLREEVVSVVNRILEALNHP